MEHFYKNFSFINQYLKEERTGYTSVYVGMYRGCELVVNISKLTTRIALRTPKQSNLIKLPSIECIQTKIDEVINVQC